jgi:VWFA-related protein
MAGVLRAQEAVFRSDVQLVEVLAALHDDRGKYMDSVGKDSFEILDNGEPQTIVAFEAVADTSRTPLSCAVLIDITGSMQEALPAVKNSVLKFIERLRPIDQVAVYGFSGRLLELQSFTLDKAAARQAVLRTRASGQTAVYDAVSELSSKVGQRNGRKAIVLFTDGDDNSSLLTPQSAVNRAKKAGVPIYTIAEGAAASSKKLTKQLETIAQLTGGLAYEASKLKDVDEVFASINEDLKHIYLLAYRPPAARSEEWRSIQLRLKGVKNYRVRAREGYYAI